VSVRNLEQLQAVCTMSEVKTVYYKNLPTLSKAVELARESGKKLIPQIPSVIEDDRVLMVVKKLKALNLRTVMVAEYGMLGVLKDDFDVLTDHSFNTNNVMSLAELADLNIVGSTLSYEISGSRIRKLAKNSPLPLEAIVFTRVPLMITKHCPIKTHYQHDAGSCKGKYCRVAHGLRDRRGKVMPMVKTGKCKIEILNDEHLIWLEQLDELIASGVRSFRLAFTNEREDQIRATIQAFASALHDATVDKEWLSSYRRTLGHYNRSIH
jgi:putative protease